MPAVVLGDIAEKRVKLVPAGVITAASSYTSPNFAPGVYKRIEFYLRRDSGASNQIAITLTGLTGTYRSQYIYDQAGGIPAGFKYDTAWNIDSYATSHVSATFHIATGGRRFAYWKSFTANDAGTGTLKSVDGYAENADTTHDVTGFVLTFAAAETGVIEVYGVS